MDFFVNAKDEFDEYAETIPVKYGEKDIKVVFAQSNHLKLGAYARSEYGGHANVIVVQNKKGNVVITTNKLPINLNMVIMGLRNLEAKLKGKTIPFEQLMVGGTVDYASEWYYDIQSCQILNGSKSAPNVPATKITFNNLKKIIIEQLEKTDVQSRNLSMAS